MVGIFFTIVFNPFLQAACFWADLQWLQFGQSRFKLASEFWVKVTFWIDRLVRFKQTREKIVNNFQVHRGGISKRRHRTVGFDERIFWRVRGAGN